MSLKHTNNPNLKQMRSDYLYHIAVNVPDTTNAQDIKKQFGHIKAVFMGGKDTRMRELAEYIHKHVYKGNSGSNYNEDIFAKGHRYAGFMVGCVLCVSHGIGSSTMSVVLHEIIKLLNYAECVDPVIIRVGTCGGLGVKPGTVIVTKDAYNGLLRNEHEIAILGDRVVRPASFNEDLCKALVACARPDDDWLTCVGNTMSTDCFYEGQGRTDGASCTKKNGVPYTAEDKMIFLNRCYNECGVRNIEMEATMFASLTLNVGLRAADVCVTLIDRLNGDQVTVTPKQMSHLEEHPFEIVARYLARHIVHV